MTKLNPKGILFWLAIGGVCTCIAVGSTPGALAFGVMAALVAFLG